MSIFETIDQVKSEQHSDNLIADICEFMGVEESEFPGATRNTHDTMMKVIYFAVRHREHKINGKYIRSNVSAICNVFGRHRTSGYHYKRLLKDDRMMRDMTTDFLSKFNYQSQILKP